MRKIVVDMQNFLFADSVAIAFKNSDYEIDVVRTESPKDTVELCKLYKPFVLIMEVTGYTPWKLCERMKLRDEVKSVCPDCKIAFIVDSNTEKQAAKDIRDAKKAVAPVQKNTPDDKMKSPKTGNDSLMVIWTTMILAAALAFMGLTTVSHRRK